MEVSFKRDPEGNIVIKFGEPVTLKEEAPAGIMSIGTVSGDKPVANKLGNIGALVIFKDLL